jgi:ABC-type lipoprotein release transport system permease subunit
MLEKLHLAPELIIPLAAVLVVFGVLVVVSKVPLGYNLRNLLVRWPITVLTALAFTLVVALLTVMLAFVNGMTRLTEGSGHPGNVIILSDGATDELFSNLLYSDISNIDRQPGVLTDSETRRPLCSREVYIVVNQPIPSEEGTTNRRRFVQVRGIEDALISAKVHNLELFPGGKWFSEAGVQELPREAVVGGERSASSATAVNAKEQAIQVVLGEGVARILGADKHKERLDVGDTFEMGPRKWVVTGIMKSEGTTFGSEVWAKRSLVGPMFGKEQITCLVVRTKDAEAATAVADDLSKNFKPAVRAEPEKVYYSKLGETNKQFLGAVIFVAVIMAIGGVFGVMNTMFAAISQRTKDIGVLRILGFARRQILVSFFLETLLIALVGGLLGCALGYLSDGWSASSIVSGGQGSNKTVVLKMTVDANTIAVGLLFTLVMGSLGGLVPSLSAMRLRPLESLK